MGVDVTGVRLHTFLEMVPPPCGLGGEVAEGARQGGAGEVLDEGVEGVEIMDDGGSRDVGGGGQGVWELYERDGVAPFVWREGRVTGYGLQGRAEQGPPKQGGRQGDGREVVVAWVVDEVVE